MKTAKTDSHFLIHVSEDKEGIANIPVELGFYDSKKDAKKAMKRIACEDIVHGRYYYYHLMEQKTIRHETYPSTEESK